MLEIRKCVDDVRCGDLMTVVVERWTVGEGDQGLKLFVLTTAFRRDTETVGLFCIVSILGEVKYPTQGNEKSLS